MSKTVKQMIFGSMGACGLVALLAILDIATGIPYSGNMMMDIFFIIGAALVLYMGWETYREMS